MEYAVLAYYCIAKIESREAHMKAHKKFLTDLGAKGRIYVCSDGLNGVVSLLKKDVETYESWLKSDLRFAETDIKLQDCPAHPFEKLTVKVKKELVAVDLNIDFDNRGQYMTAGEWREAIEEGDENTIIVDVRNNYESKIGSFEGAIKPDLKTFRGFPKVVEQLKKEYDLEKTRVMMFCTGGIRCEVFSPLVKEAGFKNVYQLKGGVIRYGIEEGKKHWKGKLFVFDDRLVVPISEDNDEIISNCAFCETLSDKYYNCANLDCNELFLSCPDCYTQRKGCCQKDCQENGRLREHADPNNPIPFRKLPKDLKDKLTAEHHKKTCCSCSIS